MLQAIGVDYSTPDSNTLAAFEMTVIQKLKMNNVVKVPVVSLGTIFVARRFVFRRLIEEVRRLMEQSA